MLPGSMDRAILHGDEGPIAAFHTAGSLKFSQTVFWTFLLNHAPLRATLRAFVSLVLRESMFRAFLKVHAILSIAEVANFALMLRFTVNSAHFHGDCF